MELETFHEILKKKMDEYVKCYNESSALYVDVSKPYQKGKIIITFKEQELTLFEVFEFMENLL